MVSFQLGYAHHAMVATWPHKDNKLVTLKISTDPSFIQSTGSKTMFKQIREWGKMIPGFSLADSKDLEDFQPMRNQDLFSPTL